MTRTHAIAIGLAAVLMTTAAHAAPRPEQIEAPRGQAVVEAPRGQDTVQAPRGQERVEAPRG